MEKKGWICVSITLLFVCAHICRHASHQDRAESVGLHSFHRGWRIASQVTLISAPGKWEKRSSSLSINKMLHVCLCICVFVQVCACECMVVVKLWASQAEPPPSSVPGLVWVRILQTFGNSQRSWGAGWPQRSGGLQSLASPCDSPALGTGPWAEPAYSYTPICFLFIWALSYTSLECLTAVIDISH